MTDLHAARLERRLRATQALALTAFGLVAALALGGGRPDPTHDEVRTRRLVVVDSLGRARVVVGAPVPSSVEGERVSPATGLAIYDGAGFERFAVGLQETGAVVLGLDAPPGTGDDRNRERITLVAAADGGAYLRLLNRQTAVPFRLYLDEDDQAYLEFLQFGEREVVRQRLGFGVADTLRHPR